MCAMRICAAGADVAGQADSLSLPGDVGGGVAGGRGQGRPHLHLLPRQDGGRDEVRPRAGGGHDTVWLYGELRLPEGDTQ